MGLGDIFGNIVDAVTGRNNNDEEQNTADPAFDNNADASYQVQEILPASMDPMGDPADDPQYAQAGDDILPASMDPLGDPADDPQYASNNQFGDGDILPASEDPLGDPADQQGYRQ